MDYRNGIDVMTTETTCLSSVWETDKKTADYLELHGRGGAYKEMHPEDGAYYDGAVVINLSKILKKVIYSCFCFSVLTFIR